MKTKSNSIFKFLVATAILCIGLTSQVSPANAAISSSITVTQNPDGSVTFSWTGESEEYIFNPDDEDEDGNVLHVCPSTFQSCSLSLGDELTYYYFMQTGDTSFTIPSTEIESGSYVAQMVMWVNGEEQLVGSLVSFSVGFSSPTIANGYRADALGSVYFAPGSSKLSKAAQDQLKALVTANPTAIYKVTGYVQKSGTSVNDAKLSLARAKSVESYLASLGAGVTFNVVVDTGLVPAKEGTSAKARKATLFAMTPVVQ